MRELFRGNGSRVGGKDFGKLKFGKNETADRFVDAPGLRGSRGKWADPVGDRGGEILACTQKLDEPCIIELSQGIGKSAGHAFSLSPRMEGPFGHAPIAQWQRQKT